MSFLRPVSYYFNYNCALYSDTWYDTFLFFLFLIFFWSSGIFTLYELKNQVLINSYGNFDWDYIEFTG